MDGMTINVAVVGAAGRMGSTVCTAVTAAPDMNLTARITKDDPINAQTLAGATVGVDFTVPDATEDTVRALLTHGCHAVVGATGWTPEKIARIEAVAKETGRHVLIAPNFGLSAVLTMMFAEMAAPYFESVEVVEMHHPDKVDAPSGTARATAEKIAAARAAAGCAPAPDATVGPAPARGEKIAGIPVHAVRLRGLNAHETVLLGNPGEQLTLRQDSFTRESFMPGVLLAIRGIDQHPGVQVGLERYMSWER